LECTRTHAHRLTCLVAACRRQRSRWMRRYWNF